MSGTWRRMLVSAVAALVTLIEPWVLLSFVSSTALRVLAVIAPVVATFVFALLARQQPRWAYGLLFAALAGFIAGVWRAMLILIGPESAQSGQPWPAIYRGAYAGGIVFIAGMIGNWIASLVGRALEPDPWAAASRRIQTWHIGTAVALLFIAVAAAFAIVAF